MKYSQGTTRFAVAERHFEGVRNRILQWKRGGTRMTDIVRYRLPFGIVGRAVHSLRVRRDIGNSFDYRFKRVNELFAGNALAEAN